MTERTGCHGCVYAQWDSDGCTCRIDSMLVWNPAKGCKYRKPEIVKEGATMTSNEKKFLNELANLFSSYAIEEVRCEEINGSKNIVFYSNGRFLSFRIYKDETYYDILSQISEYTQGDD